MRRSFSNISGGSKSKFKAGLAKYICIALPPLRWLMVYNRFERFTFSKPPALPEVADSNVNRLS